MHEFPAVLCLGVVEYEGGFRGSRRVLSATALYGLGQPESPPRWLFLYILPNAAIHCCFQDNATATISAPIAAVLFALHLAILMGQKVGVATTVRSAKSQVSGDAPLLSCTPNLRLPECQTAVSGWRSAT